jgi:hypothetical protein
MNCLDVYSEVYVQCYYSRNGQMQAVVSLIKEELVYNLFIDQVILCRNCLIIEEINVAATSASFHSSVRRGGFLQFWWRLSRFDDGCTPSCREDEPGSMLSERFLLWRRWRKEKRSPYSTTLQLLGKKTKAMVSTKASISHNVKGVRTGYYHEIQFAGINEIAWLRQIFSIYKGHRAHNRGETALAFNVQARNYELPQ